MTPILINTIKSHEKLYETVGDYRQNSDFLHVTVVEQDNEDYEFLVAIHELVEWYITKKRGIKEQSITDYDIAWESRSSPKADEPGNEYDSPYKKEHRFAENIERQIAHEIGVDWQLYDKELKI